MKKTSEELIFWETREQLNKQFSCIANLTTKFSFLLAFNGALAIIFVQALSNIHCILWEIFFAVPMLSSIVFVLWGLQMRTYYMDPNPRKLYDGFLDGKITDKNIQEELTKTYINAYEKNEKHIFHITKLFRWSLLLSGITYVICLSIFVIPQVQKKNSTINEEKQIMESDKKKEKDDQENDTKSKTKLDLSNPVPFSEEKQETMVVIVNKNNKKEK